MPANYLHGVETTTHDTGAKPIRVVKSAVIGIVGTAPIQSLDVANQTINKPVLLTSEVAAAKFFGAETAGYSLPTALKAVFKKGAATVIAVNVFNPAIHKTGETPDPTLVTNADIIGTVDAAGNRTGMQAWLNAYSLFGFKPKILIAPGWSFLAAIRTELETLAERLHAVTYTDAPVGTTFQQAIEGRGPSGTVNLQTSARRDLIHYPHLLVYDAVSNNNQLQPYSAFAAGIRAWKDLEFGYWWSNSNTQIDGIVGTELPLTGEINDSTSEINLLNEAGIVTVFNSFGTGFRTWGSRSAAWPSESGPNTFEACIRTGDVIGDSIEYAMLQFIDRPFSQAFVDSVTESVRSFQRKLVGDGAILDGNCWYDPADNETTELSNGHVTFRYDYMWPPTMERITFVRTMNLDYLSSIGGSN